MAENILSIKQYFEKGTFVIPNYQRGYKWGVPNEDDSCAVSVLMDSLVEAFNSNLPKYFIQGVTVSEENGNIIIIDGQQRTTTFFLLLKYLGLEKLPTIDYTIRKESKEILEEIRNGKIDLSEFSKETGLEEFQDIHYFKKAIRTFETKIDAANFDKTGKSNDKSFKDYILENVKLFYIEINKDKATKVFSMMNGQKAIMKPDELIKSALLSKASRTHNKEQIERATSEESLTDLLQIIKNKVGEEWEINSLRSKYAREWDKWLYWWNRPDVKSFFGAEKKPLGLLLEYYFELNRNKETEANKKYSFKNFNAEFFNGNDDKGNKIKRHFKQLRDLQKRFEDLYNNYESYNYLGLILKTNSNIKKDAIEYFLKSSNENELKDYAKWASIGVVHSQIIVDNDEKERKALEIVEILKNKDVYWDKERKKLVFNQLLRINVDEDNKLQRRFDFSIWDNKSLEHIHAKSRNNELKSIEEFHEFKDSEQYGVHCIGNLVLLDKDDNSALGPKEFQDKKKILFNTANLQEGKREMKKSLKLMHTLKVFSSSEWNEKSIMKNQKNFLSNFEKYYNYKLEKEIVNEN